MNYLNISQKANNNGTHQGDKAIDISGGDRGIDSFRAPFTGIVKRVYKNVNAVWLESLEKVKYADGTVDYMTIMTLHDNDVGNLIVGQVIEQNKIYYQEGRKGLTTGNHIHLAVGKGKFKGNGWIKNKYGYWVVNNQYDVHKALYLLNSVKVIDDGGYDWIITNDFKESDSNTIVYFKQYNGDSPSIVDALKAIDVDSKFSYRSKIAKVNGIKAYTGTKTQNEKLLKLLKSGKLLKP